MSQEPEIPLLTDLIAKGGEHAPTAGAGRAYSTNENQELQFEADADEPVADESDAANLAIPEDEIDEADYHSVQELLIEEEIRLILDKHMDHAYEEIIRLINHRIS